MDGGAHGQLCVRSHLDPVPGQGEFLSIDPSRAQVVILPRVCCVTSGRALLLSGPELAKSQI